MATESMLVGCCTRFMALVAAMVLAGAGCGSSSSTGLDAGAGDAPGVVDGTGGHVDVGSSDGAPPTDGGAVDGGLPDVAGNDSGIAYNGNNNGAVITGSAFPLASADNSVLRRTVTVSHASANPEFLVSSATIARKAADATEAFYAMIPVTSAASRPYCFVAVGQIEYLNGSDTVIASATFRDVNGSVGRTGSVYTPTCLAPGETGYFCDVQLFVNYADVARVVIDISADPDDDLHDPDALLVPLSYTFDAVTGLTVTLKNEGTGTASIFDGSSFFILLDGSQQPLWWHILKTPASPADLVLAPGQTGTLVDANVHYEGSGTAIRLFFDYEDQ